MRSGVFYWHPRIYDAALYLLYRGKPQERFRQVAARIPAGARVVDLCAGTAFLYGQLRQKGVRYQAYDLNPRLVAHLRQAGVEAYCADVRQGEFPAGDVLVMCSSLYQFYPDCRAVVEGMIARARDRVVILEPVRNAFHSPCFLVRWLGSWAGAIEGRAMRFYFKSQTFSDLARQIPQLQELEVLSGGRDMLAVFAGTARD